MNLIMQLEQELVERLQGERAVPDFRPGDTVRVNVKVIEGTDPSKYPVVRPNEFFTQASTKDQSIDREHYQELLDFINEAYKKALVQYGAIWDFIVKNPLKFPKSFFIAAKDCIDRFGSCSLFSRSAYYGYIKEVLQVATAKR